MVESHLVGGRQDIIAGQALRYGQSVTDACIDWPTSVRVLEALSRAVTARCERLSGSAQTRPRCRGRPLNPSPASQ
jgi:3-deoxy-7-phosphoheptulonate synthase